ncbi:MAG: hypothetical protein RIK87_24545 [Fuerstiella sp.]
MSLENGLLSGALNVSNAGLNQSRYLFDPQVPDVMRAQTGRLVRAVW